MTEGAAHELKRLLGATQQTIAAAESVTGGCLQAEIASVSGSSEYFLGGVTAYNLDQKVRLLGVDRQHAAEVNCVSAQVAVEMASGVRRMFGAFVGVSTTGYAEPSPAADAAAPFAYYAVNIGGWWQHGRIEAAQRSRVAAQRHLASQVLKAVTRALHELAALPPALEELAPFQAELRKLLR